MMNVTANVIEHRFPVNSYYKDLDRVEEVKLFPKIKIFNTHIDKRSSDYAVSSISFVVKRVKTGYARTC